MRGHLRNVFARRDDPYAGVDLENASRFGGALWFVGAFVVALTMPFVPPDDRLGGTGGWIVAFAVMAGGLVAGWRMRHIGPRANPDELLMYSYAGVASLGVLVWLSGGVGSPYQQLMILSAVYTCASHPARRVLGYLAFFVAVALLPLLYTDHVSARSAAQHAIEVVVWMALVFTVVLLMHNVRVQRVGLRREGEQARRQARVDPLTGLLNRRAFDEDLAQAIGGARAGAEPLSVLVGDLDDFKDFNDRYGHLEGDRVLKAVAAALRAALRRPDVAYRWGGDEFALILPQADRAGAELVAQRVRVAIAGCSGPDGDALGMSTGVAEYDRGAGTGAAELLDLADHQLMSAKGGRPVEVPHTRG